MFTVPEVCVYIQKVSRAVARHLARLNLPSRLVAALETLCSFPEAASPLAYAAIAKGADRGYVLSMSRTPLGVTCGKIRPSVGFRHTCRNPKELPEPRDCVLLHLFDARLFLAPSRL